MQNIFEKIDTLFSGENDDKPVWAVDILNELKSIRVLLEQNNTKTLNSVNDKNEYYEFIKQFRVSMRADVNNDTFPYIIYSNKKLGINFKGYLYDIDKSIPLSNKEAFEVYKYAYKNKPRILI